ncbi:hypothetical protein [Paenibacillus illinoisensis]
MERLENPEMQEKIQTAKRKLLELAARLEQEYLWVTNNMFD